MTFECAGIQVDFDMAVALAQGIEFRRIRGLLLGGLMGHQTLLTVQTLLTDSASCPLPELVENP